MKDTFVLFFLIVVHSGLLAQKMDIYQRPVTLEPDRDFDAIHYSIKLDIDMDGKQLKGQNTVILTPLRSGLNSVSLDALPVNYWVYERHEKDARRSFAKKPYTIDFFTSLNGYAYPWEKYDQVVSAHQGGRAEATSATLLGEGAVTTVAEAIDFSFEGILVHEVAHQWWGDLVTLRNWEHSWINESFAT